MIYVFLILGICGSLAWMFLGVRLFTESESTFWGLVGLLSFIVASIVLLEFGNALESLR